jgi:pyruvate/2-oxoglutarate dehydrogenase complex dihydrolipoamide dehydrogenase (E3) component
VRRALDDGTTRAFRAESIFIDTGAAPARPAIPGLDQVPALDSTSIMELDTLPRHLLVLGGGYVGIEFARCSGASAARSRSCSETGGC